MKKIHWILLVLAIVVTVYYYLVSPAEHPSLTWGCPFHLLTGLDCPLCGGQRAYHAFLHGEFMEALAYNYFLVIAVPYLAMLVCLSLSEGKIALILEKIVFNKYVFGTFMVLLLAWLVVRNVYGL